MAAKFDTLKKTLDDILCFLKFFVKIMNIYFFEAKDFVRQNFFAFKTNFAQ